MNSLKLLRLTCAVTLPVCVLALFLSVSGLRRVESESGTVLSEMTELASGVEIIMDDSIALGDAPSEAAGAARERLMDNPDVADMVDGGMAAGDAAQERLLRLEHTARVVLPARRLQNLSGLITAAAALIVCVLGLLSLRSPKKWLRHLSLHLSAGVLIIAVAASIHTALTGGFVSSPAVSLLLLVFSAGMALYAASLYFVTRARPAPANAADGANPGV